MAINITSKTIAKNQPSVPFPSSQPLIKSRPLLGHAGSSSLLLQRGFWRVPAGIIRRALRRKRRKKLVKKGLLPPQTKSCGCVYDDTELKIHPMASVEDSSTEFDEEAGLKEEEEAMVKLEKEMWETFHGTGFWRSPSQRELPFVRSVGSPRG
ncbi:hypothetical protein OIU85_017147 [Salix viminalis]|uniref:Uncharacterized protein n=1 Tax=Salix viminalis TaxID=40686 RepID=A0A9Q0ZQJ6_SALVM|nr:hypothetical protein OIU85_017147 [Salix viminalis]